MTEEKIETIYAMVNGGLSPVEIPRRGFIDIIRTQPKGVPIRALLPVFQHMAEICVRDGDLVMDDRGVLRCP